MSSTSSTTNPLKHPASDDQASSESSAKKPKLADSDVNPSKLNNNNNDNDTNRPAPNKTSSSLNGNNDKHEANGENSSSPAADDGAEIGNNPDGVFDPKISKTLEQVEIIQQEIFKLNEKASEEILKVEQKFNDLRRPHFEKRNELLKEVPNFWLTSLANHPMLAPMIESAHDEECLRFMVNLDVEECEDIKSGYKLKLYFAENPYMTNDVIVKQFQIVSSDEVVSSSTPVEFKNTPQGKALQEVVQSSVQQYRRSGRRPGESHQSFFAWLSEPQSGTDDIADILKEQIWPNPVEWFFAPGDEDNISCEEEEEDEFDEDEENFSDEEGDDEEVGIEEELYGEEDEEDEENEEGDDN